ncbi:glucosidase family protein [Paenibacillus cymbidii]|uniref:hypothetical protein n=1 Tax=Paenibacillus cymbidii TaxID=1639034 RepID=UPI00107FEDEC|nr:hypothetical protein [Paenibacillus cymbidii]
MLAWEDLFALKRSDYFRASLSGETGHHRSYYAAKPRLKEGNGDECSLSFDISNNRIQASLGADGAIRTVCMIRSIQPCLSEKLRGTFVEKEPYLCGPWTFDLRNDREERLERTGITTELIENIVPLTTFAAGSLACATLAFAPLAPNGADAPAGIVYALHLHNRSTATTTGSIELVGRTPKREWSADEGAAADAWQCEVVGLDHADAACESVPYLLQPGESLLLPLAVVCGANRSETAGTAELLRSKPILAWLSDTLDDQRGRLGKLTVTGEPYYADSFVRMEELCRQSLMRLRDNTMAGGFLGSNTYEEGDFKNRFVWMKDTFYASLAMTAFRPELGEQAILFYLRWGVSTKTFGRGVERFPDADPVTHSLSNSLSGLILAASYYRANGNTRFWGEHPEVFGQAQAILERVLQSRLYPDIYLFPAMYISDGDARGDFHTGSNVLVWYSLRGMARLARDVYDKRELADEWEATAARVKRDIESYCRSKGVLGEQYFEGAYADGSFVACHDGEETDVALMPYYGFTESDDPALLHFSRLALTPHNQLYTRAVDGVAWLDSGYCSASTFPAFVTAIAGAGDESALAHALERIRRLTDLDGSIWWWPHGLDSDAPANVQRQIAKCCWAASVYVLKLMHDLFGIQVDVPAATVAFRPFAPWPQFEWTGCSIGSAAFDLYYNRSGQTTTGTIINRSDNTYEARIELTLPDHVLPLAYRINDIRHSEDRVRFRNRYSRSSYVALMKLAPGESLTFEVQFAGGGGGG